MPIRKRVEPATTCALLFIWSHRQLDARALNRRSRRLLETTKTEENAIAAPASMPTRQQVAECIARLPQSL